MASEFFKIRVINKTTGDSQLVSEDAIEIEIDGEGLVSLITPIGGSREFLLSSEQLEQVKAEVKL